MSLERRVVQDLDLAPRTQARKELAKERWALPLGHAGEREADWVGPGWVRAVARIKRVSAGRITHRRARLAVTLPRSLKRLLGFAAIHKAMMFPHVVAAKNFVSQSRPCVSLSPV
jgi:hypothetical protein